MISNKKEAHSQETRNKRTYGNINKKQSMTTHCKIWCTNAQAPKGMNI